MNMSTEIESLIHKLTTLQLNTFTKNIGWIVFVISFIVLMLGGGILGLLGAIILTLILNTVGLQSLASYSGILILFGTIYTPLKVVKILNQKNPFQTLSKNTLKLYRISREVPYSVQKINTTIDLIEIAHQEIIFLEKYKKFGFFLSQKSRANIMELQSLVFPIIYTILKDLQQDIFHHTEIQKQKLQKAKSEVTKNITGTTVLNQVSELQKARLDTQIEQFEELQRVLVKV